MKKYNTTQLDPEVTFTKHVFHRDQFAHYLRWTHVLKRAKIGQNVLDVGCGSGNLLEVFYRNRYKPTKYLGLEYKQLMVDRCNEKYKSIDWAKFKQCDIVTDKLTEDTDWDIITSFEVIEHIGKQNADALLDNVEKVMNKDSVFLLSTPVYDEKVGAAGNHTYDSGDGRGVAIHEFGYNELKEILERHFTIEENFGTFASQKDYKDKLTPEQKTVFNELTKYYDSNLVSVLFAPMHPEYSRNVLWVLRKK